MQLSRRDKRALSFPLLSGTPEVAGIYNIIYRYLFDRRRDLAMPTSFLIDEEGMIVKVYQGPVDPKRLLEDVKSTPRTAADRVLKALPLPGKLYLDEFQRNDFTYGVAFFQHGYLQQAEASFKQVIATKPDDPEAYYNLGTLYLRRNALDDARKYLEQTVKLRPDYPEAWNNLGMLAAQEGNAAEATRNFQQSLQIRPDYAIALLNLGNLYRREGSLAEAEEFLSRALELQPDDPEVNYNLGMLYARQEQLDRASAVSGKRDKAPSRLSRRAQQPGRHICSRKKILRGGREVQGLHWCCPEFRSGVPQSRSSLCDPGPERKSPGSFARIAAPATPAQGGPANAGNAKLTFGGLIRSARRGILSGDGVGRLISVSLNPHSQPDRVLRCFRARPALALRRSGVGAARCQTPGQWPAEHQHPVAFPGSGNAASSRCGRRG